MLLPAGEAGLGTRLLGGDSGTGVRSLGRDWVRKMNSFRLLSRRKCGRVASFVELDGLGRLLDCLGGGGMHGWSDVVTGDGDARCSCRAG